jgi:hypothetical protein
VRSREMHNKLDKLSVPSEDDNQTASDISLLSPEDHDRVHEVLAKLKDKQEIRARLKRIL